jgi:hypothetical protein
MKHFLTVLSDDWLKTLADVTANKIGSLLRQTIRTGLAVKVRSEE